ncbi:hypothetical protein [Spirosoma luteum]|uniref:hypothetical protein n=1 Tax=Spirosoma luteum TaxID=431553 RepID=UPI003CCC1A5B
MYCLCDRLSNCGYHLSPYHTGPWGQSYNDEMKPFEEAGSLSREWFVVVGKPSASFAGCT